MKVSSITPGVCSVNMPEPEADTRERLFGVEMRKACSFDWSLRCCREMELITLTSAQASWKNGHNSDIKAGLCCSLLSSSSFTFAHSLDSYDDFGG